jgi:hypothetical protein
MITAATLRLISKTHVMGCTCASPHPPCTGPVCDNPQDEYHTGSKDLACAALQAEWAEVVNLLLAARPAR